MAQAEVRPKHEELLAAAIRLFRERGYHATSMQHLAEAVGIQRGSLYHYIEAKEDLLWEIMERAIGRLLAAVEPIARSGGAAADRVRRAVAAHLEVAAMLRDELTVLHVELKSLSPTRRRAMIAYRDRYQDLFRFMVRDGLRGGEFRDVDPHAAVFAILGACNWFTQWFRPDGKDGYEVFAASFADLFLQGLHRPIHAAENPR
ncbi:MAG: TetR/AcrR family transcriptional regulator [Armatimonadetes bacterium]|nr:TetR/AcrR family transcriptional regulator [Armatimonadota bacterium]